MVHPINRRDDSPSCLRRARRGVAVAGGEDLGATACDRQPALARGDQVVELLTQPGDVRIDALDAPVDIDIARLRQQLDDLIASRKRWLAVTGGRSKVFATGNGHAAASSA